MYDEGGYGMNQIETNLKKALADAAKKAFDTEVEIEKIVIEIPKDKSHGDYSTNLAMQLTRLLKTIHVSLRKRCSKTWIWKQLLLNIAK